ncbi:MAG: IgGFc-binding protein, partial [Myxococcota bacterium]|nr:IgGFc-binding protein [Myxococcota bacterium]
FRLQTDFPVVVYQFSPYCCNYSFSNDASLLLPTAALGVKYRFLGVPVHMIRGPFGDVQEGGKAMAAVVSPKDNNRVTVQMPAGLVILPDSTGRVAQAGDSVEVNMDEQDVLLVMASGQSNQRDLSGALIESQYPVAVFSAHLCSYYPENLSACDHLQEQLFPMSTWGTSFQLVPPAERNRNWATEVIYWKFVAGDQVTRFQLGLPFNQLNAVSPGFELVSYCGNFLEGPDTFVLRPGQTCEFGTKRSVQVVSDQPAMVMGIIAGQEATGLLNFGSRAGDPAIFLVPPDQQYRRDYTFLAPDTYFRDYVTVVTTPGNEIQLDGQLVSLNDALPVGGSNFVFKHVALTDGPHQMTARSPFGIVVYAYDDFVSYAFTGGLNLTKR